MSQIDGCQTPPTRRLPEDHQPILPRRKSGHRKTTNTPTSFANEYYDGDSIMVYSKKKRSSNKNSIKNRRRRSAGRRNTFPESSEAATLRSELVAIHKSYRSILQEKDEEIEALNRLNAEASSFIFHQTKSHVAAVKEFEKNSKNM